MTEVQQRTMQLQMTIMDCFAPLAKTTTMVMMRNFWIASHGSQRRRMTTRLTIKPKPKGFNRLCEPAKQSIIVIHISVFAR